MNVLFEAAANTGDFGHQRGVCSLGGGREEEGDRGAKRENSRASLTCSRSAVKLPRFLEGDSQKRRVSGRV